MQCPKCQSLRGRVTSTFNHGSVVQRYRHCLHCGHRWKAWEEVDPTPVRPKKSKTADLFAPRPANDNTAP